MYYTILYATSLTSQVMITFDKCGNWYVVHVFSNEDYRTLDRFESTHYDQALADFWSQYHRYNMDSVAEPKHDWDASDFD